MPGVTVWFTGLSGAGKTTLSHALEQHLLQWGYPVERLDGDMIRNYLSKGLGFSKADRDENVRRIGFVSHLLSRHGVIVLAAAISPYRDIRQEVRALHQQDPRSGFVEVYVNAPLTVCESRDVKGLYHRARKGEIQHFTGISDPYEPPLDPEVECRTDLETPAQSLERVLQALRPWLGSIAIPE